MTQDITADYSHLPSRPAHAMYLQTDLESLNPPQTCSHCLSGTPELWSTVAACFDDMLSAHDNLGRLPVDNPSLYPRAATVGSSAYNNQQSNASKLATSGCISDRLSPVYSNSSLPSQESDHQLPPMPKSSTHAGLQLSLVSFTVRRPKMKTSKFIGSLYE